jgi:hypothetical protein
MKELKRHQVRAEIKRKGRAEALLLHSSSTPYSCLSSPYPVIRDEGFQFGSLIRCKLLKLNSVPLDQRKMLRNLHLPNRLEGYVQHMKSPSG